MPKELTPLDATLMDGIAVAAVHHAAEVANGSQQTLMERLASITQMAIASSEIVSLQDVTTPGPNQLAVRSNVLVAKAREQSYHLLDAARLVLPRQVRRHQESVAAVLQNSTSIGRVFGAVSSGDPLVRPSNDDRVLMRIGLNAGNFLEFVEAERRVRFSAEGKQRLLPSLRPDAGCPALHQTLGVGNGAAANLFNVGWQEFTQSYIDERVRRRRFSSIIFGK